MTAATAMTVTEMTLPNVARLRCRGVATVSERSRRSAILPISVSMPVRTATASPLPRTTKVEPYSMFFRSPRASPSFKGAAVLTEGRDSPVSADSSTLRALAVSTRQSAATRSPSSKSRISPGTTSSAGMTASAPSRRTRAFPADSCLSRSMALSARTC